MATQGEKGEGRREKGEGRREKGEGRREKGSLGRLASPGPSFLGFCQARAGPFTGGRRLDFFL